MTEPCLDKTAPLPRRTTPGTDGLFLWDPLTDRFFPLRRGPLTIGKDPSCEIRLSHATVSRRHARILGGAGEHAILDLDSNNGTWLRSVRVDRSRVELHDVVVLGGNPLVVTREPAADSVSPPWLASFMTRNRELSRLLQTADKIARTPHHVLITGETGTGKEWMARFLHERSTRSRAPLVPVNCGAIARDLLESELFGHCRGAFTGAAEARGGLISQARGGTLFLDEIGELRPDHQAALLRFLENRTYRPVGSDRELTSDARLVAATHANLPHKVRDGLYREDLMYRLTEMQLDLVPLRCRLPDLPLLTAAFEAPPIPPDMWDRLLAHPWPGNLRELRHLCTQAGVFGWEEALAHMRPVESRMPTDFCPNLPSDLKDLEKDMILSALAREGHNTSAAARSLRLPRSTLVNRMRSLGIGPTSEGRDQDSSRKSTLPSDLLSRAATRAS